MEPPCALPKCSNETTYLEEGETASSRLHFPFASAPCVNPRGTGSHRDRVWERCEDALGQARCA